MRRCQEPMAVFRPSRPGAAPAGRGPAPARRVAGPGDRCGRGRAPPVVVHVLERRLLRQGKAELDRLRAELDRIAGWAEANSLGLRWAVSPRSQAGASYGMVSRMQSSPLSRKIHDNSRVTAERHPPNRGQKITYDNGIDRRYARLAILLPIHTHPITVHGGGLCIIPPQVSQSAFSPSASAWRLGRSSGFYLGTGSPRPRAWFKKTPPAAGPPAAMSRRLVLNLTASGGARLVPALAF